MSSNSGFVVTDDFITVSVDGKVVTADNSHPAFENAVNLVREQRLEEAVEALDVKTSIEKFADGRIEVQGEDVYWVGTRSRLHLHGTIVDRILWMIGEGFDVTPMAKFVGNLMQNPEPHGPDNLYRFLETGKMPITEDGCFLAYKKVNEDYTDLHTGKVDNSPGAIITEDREVVERNPGRACGRGLHFCSYDYLGSYGGRNGPRVMLVKVNPRDVVSVPYDHNNTKGRCCRYEVVAEISSWNSGHNFQASVYDSESAKPLQAKSKGLKPNSKDLKPSRQFIALSYPRSRHGARSINWKYWFDGGQWRELNGMFVPRDTVASWIQANYGITKFVGDIVADMKKDGV